MGRHEMHRLAQHEGRIERQHLELSAARRNRSSAMMASSCTWMVALMSGRRRRISRLRLWPTDVMCSPHTMRLVGTSVMTMFPSLHLLERDLGMLGVGEAVREIRMRHAHHDVAQRVVDIAAAGDQAGILDELAADGGIEDDRCRHGGVPPPSTYQTFAAAVSLAAASSGGRFAAALSQRQRRALLHRPQGERAADLGDAGDLGEVHDEALVGFEVGHDDAQQVVAVAGHQIALHDLGPRRRGALEGLQRLLVLGRERHAHEDVDRQADRLGVEQRGIALDHARLLERLDPPPARRGGQADLLGEVGIAQAAVLLQPLENAPIDGIEGDHCVKPPNWRTNLPYTARLDGPNARTFHGRGVCHGR